MVMLKPNGEAGLKVLQTGLAIVFTLSPVFFGLAHAWSSMVFCLAVFLLLLAFPDALIHFRGLPHYFLAVCAGLGAVLFLQSIKMSQDPSTVQLEFLKWLACAAVFLLLQSLPDRSKTFFFKAAAGVAFAEACYGLIQTTFGIDRVLWRHQETHQGFATGTFLNRNHLAGLLEMGMGVQLGYLLKNLEAKDRKNSLLCSFLFFVTLAGFIKTGSRMGLISFAIAMTAGFSVRKINKSWLPDPWFWGMGAVAAAVAVYLALPQLAARFPSPNLWEQSAGGRQLVWKDTIGMIKNHFWIGTGLGTFARSFPPFQSSALLMGWTHAHQDYLELAAGLGVPAFVFWAGGFLKFLTESLQRISSPVSWGAGCGLCAILLHGLADFNFALLSQVLWFFTLLAVLHGTGRSRESGALKPVTRNGIRIACFALALLCAQKAWAGAELYKSQRAYLNRDFSASVSAAQMGLKIGPAPALHFAAGRSAYEMKDFKTAEAEMSAYTRQMPHDARGWVYLALTYKALKETPEKVKASFDEALKREPSSAWVSYLAAVYSPDHDLEKLRFSLSAHYPGHPSPYLESGLKFLWRRTGDFELLKSMTPRDAASYHVLSNFLDQNRLWEFRREIQADFLALSQAEYDQKCVEAKKFFLKSDLKSAYALFQQAWWRRQELSEAKIGMLLSGGGDRAEQWLTELLEPDEAALSQTQLDALEKPVKETANSYLQGLWAYRRAKFQQAVQVWDETDPKTRRWRSDSWLRLGQKETALKILKPALKEENPDLRELLFLKEMDKNLQKEIDDKIKQIQSRSSYKAERELWLNLMPGAVEIKIVMKSKKAGGAHVRMRIAEGDRSTEIGAWHVTSPDWKIYRAVFPTSGGGRVLLTDVSEPGVVECGPLKVRTQK